MVAFRELQAVRNRSVLWQKEEVMFWIFFWLWLMARPKREDEYVFVDGEWIPRKCFTRKEKVDA